MDLPVAEGMTFRVERGKYDGEHGVVVGATPRRVKVDLGRHGIKYLPPESIRMVPARGDHDDGGASVPHSTNSAASGLSETSNRRRLSGAKTSKLDSSSASAAERITVGSSATSVHRADVDHSGLIFLIAVTMLSMAPLTTRTIPVLFQGLPWSPGWSIQRHPLHGIDPWQGGRHNPSTIWPGARGDYARDGYTVLPGVLDNKTVTELGQFLEHLLKKFPGTPPEHLHHVILRDEPFWIKTVSDDRLLNAAAAHADFLRGPEGIALFASTYFAKPAFTGKRVLWHQDGSYWPLRPMNVLTIWVAVDHSGPGNGGMQVVRGSHRHALAKLVDDRTNELNVLGARTHTDEDLEEARNNGDVLDLILAPGDVAIFHPNIIHGSPPNTSPYRRAALTVRYMPPTVVCTDPDLPVMMMRGETPANYVNAYRSWPPLRPTDFAGSVNADEWNKRRRVEVTDPDPHYFDDTSPQGTERRRAAIHNEINNFIELLGGRSIEANRIAEREGKRHMQAGAKSDVKTVGGVKHSDLT